MNGIKIGGYHFSEPEALPLTSTLAGLLGDQGGLYAILVYDAQCTPQPFRPLYFGESNGIQSRATGTHEKYSVWSAEAGTFTTLYRALCPLPGWTKAQRQQAESALITQYDPPCNERLSVELSRLFGGS